MKYLPIDSKLFKRNRSKFVSQMLPDSIAVFNSNDIFSTGADSTLPFYQHRNIFYLSGVDQEESILVLNPNANNPAHKEILFLKETNDHIAIWEGAKLNKDQAKSSTGIQSIYWLDEFETIFSKLMTNVNIVYFNNNNHYRKAVEMQTREDRFLIWLKSNYPEHKIEYSFPIMEKLRGVKEPEEIELIQKACDITEKGFRRVLKFLKPGVMEFHVEAEYSHEFLRNRSKGFAYTPIIASGYNACILHYINNNMQCKDGDMLLMDVGAEYANYSSDMTRTIPVNGRFTDRQKSVYQAVLNVKNEASKMLIPGTLWEEYHVEVGKLMTSELISLGLLDKSDIQNQNHKNPAYKKYFMHGTSHHMGLDTHDYGDLKTPMVANMVFTVEPGIYIPDENLGIRLEDDVLIKNSGTPINLMKSIPIEIEEIEEIMNS
jgi:Xaa-Pro aminopeptidase